MNHTLYSHYDRNRRAHRKSNQFRYADRQTRYHGNAFMRPMELKRMAREETADGPLLKGKPVCCPVVPGGRQHHFLFYVVTQYVLRRCGSQSESTRMAD